MDKTYWLTEKRLQKGSQCSSIWHCWLQSEFGWPRVGFCRCRRPDLTPWRSWTITPGPRKDKPFSYGYLLFHRQSVLHLAKLKRRFKVEMVSTTLFSLELSLMSSIWISMTRNNSLLNSLYFVQQ